MQNLSVSVFLFFLTGWLILRVFTTRNHGKKPPGPYRWPIIGNALQIPSISPWERFSEWAKDYGDVTYLEAFKQPTLIINSPEVANELLVKRSAIYSSRPHFVMAGELSDFDKFLAFRPYGEEWRVQRRLVSFGLSKTMIPEYHSLQEQEAHKFVSKLLAKPHDLFSEVQLRMATTIMSVTYGYYPESFLDPFLAGMLHNNDNVNIALRPGAWMVDLLPILKYLPSWMPGAGFLKKAAYFSSYANETAWNPYLWYKENLTSGKCRLPNICSTVLSEHSGPLSDEEEGLFVFAAGSVFGAALHTQSSTILFFFLMMSLHPDVQRKAQEELDRVIGTERLPTINDKENLPYVRSVIAEVMRLFAPLPLSVPHSLTADDVYNEFYLPKGAMILANVWHMFRDPIAYPLPELFNPDRYNLSDTEIAKIRDIVFGFGRRSCSGIHFAEATLFAFISTVLATCVIRPTKDEKDRDVIPEVEMGPGLFTFPRAFECRLEARSKRAGNLIDSACTLSLDE